MFTNEFSWILKEQRSNDWNISKLRDLRAKLWLEWQEEEKGAKEDVCGLNFPFGLPAETAQQLTGKALLGAAQSSQHRFCGVKTRWESFLSWLWPKSILHLTARPNQGAHGPWRWRIPMKQEGVEFGRLSKGVNNRIWPQINLNYWSLGIWPLQVI